MKQRNRRTILPLAGVVLTALAVGITARADQYSTAVLNQGPVGFWQLNETATPPVPPFYSPNIGSLGSAYNGLYFNGIPGVTPGPIVSEPANACVQFLGVVNDNSIQIPFNPAFSPSSTSPFSVEFWAQPGQNGAIQCPAACVEFIATPTAQRNGWLFYQGDSGLATGNGWVFRQYNSTGLASVSAAAVNMPLTVGQWYHVVGTFDGTSLKVYVNGTLGGTGAIAGTARGNTNSAIPLTFGSRALGASGAFSYQGSIDEGAIYNTALSAAQVAAHYAAGTSPAPATPYEQVVLGDGPVGYWRFNEKAIPTALNQGSFGTADNGAYNYDAVPGQTGPGASSTPVSLPGFAAGTKVVGFAGTNGPGNVSIPSLNLNTNTVTITAWVRPNNAGNPQTPGAGLVICDGGTTPGSGLAIDRTDGTQLAYHWDGIGTANAFSSGLVLPDGEWSFVAVAVQPTLATLYAANSQFSFGSGIFVNTLVNGNQAFDAPLEVGADNGINTFVGEIGPVAVFNRTLSTGEVFTEYAAAAGGIGPMIFTDLSGPPGTVYTGDPLDLTVDVGGTPAMTYVWFKNGVVISGATSNSLVIASSAPTDSGTYQVVVSNSWGSVTSQQVIVSVITQTTPTLISSGVHNRTLYPGGTLNLPVSASGGGLKYQWKLNGSAIAGATTSDFVIASVGTTNAGSYSLLITNKVGQLAVGPAVITIPAPVAGSYEAIIEGDGPVSWWRLDEAAGSTNMWDGLGRNDGFYTNLNSTTPFVSLGQPGALSSDSDTAAGFVSANQEFGYVPYSTSITPKELTVECWVYIPTYADNMAPVSSSFNDRGWFWSTSAGNWSPDFSTGGNTYGIQAATYLGAGAAVATGQWVHLAMLVDTTSDYPYSYYINGVTDGYGWGPNGATAPADQNNGGPLIIGAHGANTAANIADTFFNGVVDEVALYNTRLSGAQILNHYNGRFGSTTLPYFSSTFTPQTVTSGRNLSYSTTVAGSLPIGVWWTFNGTPIAGATTTSLSITNVTTTGTYTLWATNTAGTNSQGVLVTVIPPVDYANATNGLVLHLPFNGSYADTSGKGNDASPITTSPPFAAGEIGQAVFIESGAGSNSLAVADNSGDLTFGPADSFSVSLWLKTTASFNDCPIIGNAVNSTYQPGWVLTEDANEFEVSLCDTANSASYVADPVGGPVINDGTWHYLVAVVDRGQNLASAYVDGLLIKTWSIAGLGTLEYGSLVTIGSDPTGNYGVNAVFDLDDVGIWKGVLTPTQVAKIYSAGTAGGNSFNTVAPPITLTITKSGTTVTVSYNAGVLLQSSSLAAGAVWTPVSGASAPTYTFTPGATPTYFRVSAQ